MNNPDMAQESASRLSGRVLYHVGGAGNAERVDVSELFAQHLAEAGLQVEYILYDREPGPSWQARTWNGAIAWVVGRSSRSGILGALENKWRQCKADYHTVRLALDGRFDIVQIRDRYVVAPFALWAARRTQSLFTYWLSYPYAESRMLDAKEGRAKFAPFSWLLGKLEASILYRWVLKRCDYVFLQSEQMIKDVREAGAKMRRVSAVPMGISARLLDQPPVTEAPLTIGYLGTLIRTRRLAFLVDVLALVREAIPNAKLLLVGDGEDPQDREAIEARVKELNLEDAVEITGMLPMADAHRRIAESTVCVSPFFPTPILNSTSPTKISEYMALGKPVVANAHPEQSLIIEQSQAGRCVEWEESAFADALIELLNDPQEREECAARGRTWVAQHRTYERIALDLGKIYGELLANLERSPAISNAAEKTV